MAKNVIYQGEALKEAKQFTDNQGLTYHLDVYMPSQELKKVVQLAYQVGRPLLLMGEAGCGKTRLAEAVAYELHGEKMHKHFFTWNVKSTTKAQDGIYQFDYIKRMYDAQVDKKLVEKEEEIEHRYIQYGALGEAFRDPLNGDLPNILLIDEIDKADIDFPNDLLLELDKKEFIIQELGGKKITAQPNLLIFITSNEEKELPAAFLRRCLFHFIEFPNENTLRDIIDAKYNKLSERYPAFKPALDKFIELREEDLRKKPATSELLDWFKMIDHYNNLRNEDNLEGLELEFVKELQQFEETKEDSDFIPFKSILLKNSPNR